MGIKMLCLNTLRTFAKKKVQLVAIAMIIFLSSFLYATMFYALDSMKLGMEQLMSQGEQEQFSVDMVNGIMPSEVKYVMSYGKDDLLGLSLMDIKNIDEKFYETLIKRRIKAFEKTYKDYILEARGYKDVQFRYEGVGRKVRLFIPGELMNLTYIEVGQLPNKNNEIALTRVFAEKNNIQIGDSIDINGKNYVLTGYVLFPDMTLPMLGSDFIIDNSKITLGVVTPKAYERLKGEENSYLAGKAKAGELPKHFKKEVIDTVKDHKQLDFITQVTATENQLRSGVIYLELKSANAMTLGISIMISSIAVMVVAILTAKILKGEKVQIGVMKAMGYSSVEVTIPYIMMLLIIALPALILGYLAGVAIADPMKNFYLEFYLLPKLPIKPHWTVFLTAVGVPLFFILGLSFIIIKKLLGKSALELMKVGEEEKLTKLNQWVFKLLRSAKVQTKYKYSFIFKNTGKFLVFFWGICFATFLIVMSLMMVGFFEKMTVQQYQSTEYVYEGQLDFTKPKPRIRTGQEKSLTIPNTFYKDEPITFKGISSNGKLYRLYNTKGEDLTNRLEEGIIVNRSFEITYGVKIGDEIRLSLEDRQATFNIVGISKDYGDAMIFGEIGAVSRFATNQRTSKFFNGVYSIEPLNEKEYGVVMSKNDLIEQTKLMQGFMEIAIYGMIGAAIWISMLILYILTTLTVEDNYYTISLLKVMGYNKGEVSSMILNSYLVYAILTYLLTLPMVVISLKVLMIYFSRAFDIVMPMDFAFWHGVVGLIVVVLIFLLGSYSAKRKIDQVPLQEVLKAYRE